MSQTLLDSNSPSLKCDLNQKFFTLTFDNYAFLFPFFILFLVGKKWKNTIIYMIIVNYILRYIGDVIGNISQLMTPKYPTYEYPSNEGYKWGHALSRLILYTGDIIADWYLLIRTKAIVKSNKKIRWLYITCIIFNISKIAKIYFNFKYVPFKDNFNPELKEDVLDFYLRKVEYKKNKWICDLIGQITSVIYEIAVIIVLKKNVFINYDHITNNATKENFFIVKFKRLSVYRIYCTVFLSILCSPLIFVFCIKLIIGLNQVNYLPDDEKISYYKKNCNDKNIENVRLAIMNFTYCLMYLDQILLRQYSKQGQVVVFQSNNSVNSNFRNNNSNINNDKGINHSVSITTNNLKNSSFINDNRISKLYINKTHNNYEDIEGQNLISYKNDDICNNKSLSERYETNITTYNNNYKNLNNINFNNKVDYLNSPTNLTIASTSSSPTSANSKTRMNYYDINNNSNNHSQWKQYLNSLNQNY
ncbi:hypothetical protein BCR32DRAFT_22745 [Anaeromyces robustus]|uniref:Uncharacterized protein n=1 Tax=Anaeromyces robustus TaxID=1754192 RepID=A0A1Y1X3Y9_9FUNG|nr:hypothetical protein BCR32DRAFT_22745 [Anaeromyces robustus]|eukprot:ORX80365.1 hypothetical protein BCR32DRAFT_22745 [Anaeromyces robustus]